MKMEIWRGVVSGKTKKLLAEEVDDSLCLSFEPLEENLEDTVAKIAVGTIRFAKAHPILTTFAALYAWNSLKKYTEAKNSVKFYAKDVKERNYYDAMIKDMQKAGWRIVTSKYVGGTGYEWTLHRN